MTGEVKRPEFRYIKIDETKYWDQNFVARLKGNRLIATYIFDATERTYCCEITPSYFMRYVNTEVVGSNYDFNDEEWNEINDIIFEGEYQSDNDHYRHCSSVKDSILFDTNAEEIEEAIEEFQANPR